MQLSTKGFTVTTLDWHNALRAVYETDDFGRQRIREVRQNITILNWLAANGPLPRFAIQFFFVPSLPHYTLSLRIDQLIGQGFIQVSADGMMCAARAAGHEYLGRAVSEFAERAVNQTQREGVGYYGAERATCQEPTRND